VEVPRRVTDADLVAAARTGDQDAWEELYRSLYRRLRAYIARRVTPTQVDEVMAETMARAVAGIEGFEGPAGFDGWMFGLARRVVFEVNPRAETAPGDRPEPAEEHAWVRGLFDRLSPAEQEVLELRAVAGLTATAAAGVLGKRPDAVRTSQSRALTKLRKLMEADDRRSAR